MRLGIAIAVLITAINVLGAELRGRLVCNGTPISYVNVVLMNDTTFVDGSLSDDKGVFVMSDTVSECTHLKISALGYETKELPISQRCDLGDILLVEKSIVLNEVEVKGSLPTTRMKGSVLITNVENSVLSNIGTANDVLSQIPSVIGRDGDFTVFGKGTPLIYINGRLVRNKIELDQLNSSDIKSVEVNGNPGAKYGATVNSVINIITKKRKGSGLGVNIRSTNSFDDDYRNTEQVDVMWRNGKWELFGLAYINAGRNRNEIEATQTTYSDEIWTQKMSNKNQSSNLNLSGKIGINYQLNKTNSIGLYYKNGYNKSDGDASLNSVVEIDGNDYDKWYSDGSDKTHRTPNHLANLYYNGTFDDTSVDFNVDYMKSTGYGNLYQNEVSESLESKTIETYSKSKGQLFAEKLAVATALWNGQIEVGEEFTNSNLASLSDYSELSGAESRSMNEINEKNIGVFAELSQMLGNVNLSCGIRYEHVRYKYLMDGVSNNDMNKSFNHFFPSLSLSAKLKSLQMSISFTGKTRRPGYKQLDGNVNYINRITLSKGNPFLVAEKLYNADLMLGWKFLFAQVGYRYVVDPIFYTTDAYESDPSIKVISYKNASDYHRFQFFVGAQPQFGCWRPQINMGIEKQWVKTLHRGDEISLNKPIMMVQMRNSITLPYDISVNADLSFIGRGYRQNVLSKSSSSVDLSIRKMFLKRRLTLQLQGMDLFNKSRNNIVFYGGDVCLKETNLRNNRTFMLTLRYRFNVTKSKYKGTGAGESEKERF